MTAYTEELFPERWTSIQRIDDLKAMNRIPTNEQIPWKAYDNVGMAYEQLVNSV